MYNNMPQGNQPPRRPDSPLRWILLFTAIALIVGVSVFGVVYFGVFKGGSSTPTAGTQTALTPIIPSGTTITADFNSRQNHSYPIPSTLFGFNGLKKTNSSNTIFNYLKQAHLNLARIGVDVPTTFPTAASMTDPAQQQWTDLDQQMTIVQSRGMQPIVTIAYTPSWLQPQTTPCASSTSTSHVMPTLIQNGANDGVIKWGALAAQIVAHVDQKFPGVHPKYEIWNEPDGVTFLCVPNTAQAEQTRLQQYESIYVAAASQMKQQAQRDNTQINVGGPALSFPRGHAKMWITALVNNAAVAQYLDFVSYHHYLYPGSKDTWDSLLARTQNGQIGVAAEYEQIAAIVHAGKQPHPQSTPIYIDEYNTNTGPADCCRLDKTYAPLWNALFVADLLNTVVDTHSPNGAAQTVVGGLAYFSIAQPPPSDRFCMFGTINSGMDCSLNANIQPYPQYYTYQLLGDSRYLDITNGGYVIPSSSTDKSLVVSSFYTSTKDNVVIINTSSKSYSALGVLLQTPGSIQTTGSVYTLDQDHSQIGSGQVGLISTANGYEAGVTVPAYSVVAISVNTTK
ncbi:MAG TPA: hypothetical protein VJO32_11090 [Ktedonobacteraceae bacterium]|nr:hypothetical protein [Ktedonobacteraceae bacterium]